MNAAKLVSRLIITDLEHLGRIISAAFFGIILALPRKITALAADHHRNLADSRQNEHRLRLQCLPVLRRKRHCDKSEKIIAPDLPDLHMDITDAAGMIFCLDDGFLFAARQM